MDPRLDLLDLRVRTEVEDPGSQRLYRGNDTNFCRFGVLAALMAGSTVTYSTTHARLLRPRLNPQNHFAVRAMVAS
jgi:hypothetical protein